VTDELALEIERVLPAAPAVAFHAFIDPSELAKWWGPEGFTIPSLSFPARVGDSYRIEMQPPTGDPFALTGEFQEVEPPPPRTKNIRLGEPPTRARETLVRLSFGDLDDSTEVSLGQGIFRTEARLALHRDGWTDSFDKLERLLSIQA
jgi:uncharacterized protein YndB with AHSA1/START domain